MWTEYIFVEDDEVEELVSCCAGVARQIFSHNELREENCG